MPRIAPVTQANDRQQALFSAVKANLGGLPNIFQFMGRSPALLEGYLNLGKALAGGRLSGAEREAVALAIAGRNGCDYCAAAHTAIARGFKVSAEELSANLAGGSAETRKRALLRFALALQAKLGRVSDDELGAVRAVGYDDEQILELVGLVALNILTNSFNHLAATPVDFPPVSLPAAAA